MQEINSFLTAFATLNAGYGVSNDYDFSAIGVCDLNEIKSVTQRHLKLEKHDSIHIFQLENWEEQLFVENALLPLCPNSENFWFGIVPKNIMLNGCPQNSILSIYYVVSSIMMNSWLFVCR